MQTFYVPDVISVPCNQRQNCDNLQKNQLQEQEMFGNDKISTLQAEVDTLKEQLKREKEFNEARGLLLELIGVDIQRLEEGEPLTELWDAMSPLNRVFRLRVSAAKVDRDDIDQRFSEAGLKWSDEILQKILHSESLRTSRHSG